MNGAPTMVAAPTQGASVGSVLEYLAAAQQWSTSRADLLLSLDEGTRTAGTDADRLDVSVGFMAWRAVGARLDELRGVVPANAKPADRLPDRTFQQFSALLAAPVTDPDGAPVAANLNEAFGVVDALLHAVSTSVGTAQAALDRSTRLRASARTSLAEAGRLAQLLGEQVRHVAELATRLQRPDLDDEALANLTADSAAALDALTASARQRTDTLADLANAPSRLAALRAREVRVRALAERCRDRIADAPKLAVPSVDGIEPAPGTEAGGVAADQLPWSTLRTTAGAWLGRLDRLDAAFDEAERRFAAPLDERDQLRGLLQGFRDKAASAGVAETEHLGNLYATASDLLWSAPCDLEQSRGATEAYMSAVNLVVSGEV